MSSTADLNGLIFFLSSALSIVLDLYELKQRLKSKAGRFTCSLFKIRGKFNREFDALMNRILSSIVPTFYIENDAEILPAHYTCKVAFTNLIHIQNVQVKL